MDAKEELSPLRKYGTKVVKGSLRGFVEGRLDEVARRTERELNKITTSSESTSDLASNLVRTSRAQAAMRNFGRVPFHESSNVDASGIKTSDKWGVIESTRKKQGYRKRSHREVGAAGKDQSKSEREVGEWFGRVGVVRRSRHDARIVGGRDEDGETFPG